LQEIFFLKSVEDRTSRVVRCYGISQDPETKDYLMVMSYASLGSLRNYIRKNH